MNTDKIFLNIATIDFNCPECGKQYSDDKDIYLNRCNKNKSFTTRIKCDCGEKFGVAVNYHGLVSFKLGCAGISNLKNI